MTKGSSKSRHLNLVKTFAPHHSKRYSLKMLFDREPGEKDGLWRIYQKVHVLLIGAGGLGGFVGLGLARKGVKKLTICDGDIVELSNLNRQRFFLTDIRKLKGIRLARNLSREAFARSEIKGIGLYFEEALKERLIGQPDICICMPDNDEVRALAASYCNQYRIPLIVGALSVDSDYGYVFVQSSSKESACWGCFRAGEAGRIKCGAKANINLPMIIGGLALSACDTLVAKSNLSWNYRRVCLSGIMPDMKSIVSRSEQCSICGGIK